MTITLSSGKKVYANHGIIGLTSPYQELDGCRLTEGYDSPIFLHKINDDNEYVLDWTKEELLELANLMMIRWAEFYNDIQMDRYPPKLND